MEIDVNTLSKDEKIKLMLKFVQTGLFEYIKNEPFDTIFFSGEETDFKKITKEGITKIMQAVDVTCDNFSFGLETKKELFKITKLVIKMLDEKGYEKDDQLSRMAEIFYWIKISL